jgi:hypothetical protein
MPFFRNEGDGYLRRGLQASVQQPDGVDRQRGRVPGPGSGNAHVHRRRARLRRSKRYRWVSPGGVA